jgi:hypothetical protein
VGAPNWGTLVRMNHDSLKCLAQRSVQHTPLCLWGAIICQEDASCFHSNEMHACIAFVHAVVGLSCVGVYVWPGW